MIYGFIDLHTHGIDRFDTRTSSPEEILRIAELHGQKGVAAILPTIYPAPVEEMRRNMEAVRKAIEMQKSGLGQATILGLYLEGPFLNPLRCGALNKESFLRPNISSLKRLIEGYEGIIKIITIAPEIPGALRLIERCSEMGIRVNMGHSDATYKEALNGKKAGATGITHIFNAMRPFHHREPGIAGLGLMDKDLYIEVIADGLHISREVLRLIYTLKRPDRIITISDSIKGAGKKTGTYRSSERVLKGGLLDLSESAKILKEIGFPDHLIQKTLIENPYRYLEMGLQV